MKKQIISLLKKVQRMKNRAEKLQTEAYELSLKWPETDDAEGGLNDAVAGFDLAIETLEKTLREIREKP